MINVIALEGVVSNKPRFIKDKYTMIGFSVKHTHTQVNQKTKTEAYYDTYFSVSIWGRDALQYENKINEGDTVKVKGRIKWESYKNKEGVDKNAIGVVAEKIEVTKKAIQQSQLLTANDIEEELPF